MERNKQQQSLQGIHATNMEGKESLAETELPPRRTKHPSHRGRLTRWFYFTLIFLFIALTVGLMLWGKQMLHLPDGSLLD